MASGHMNLVKRPNTGCTDQCWKTEESLPTRTCPHMRTAECPNSRTSLVCAFLRYHDANTKPEKIMPLGVNPFRRGSYPANTASVPQSNREQRSP
jgi:hypothetical protein